MAALLTIAAAQQHLYARTHVNQAGLGHQRPVRVRVDKARGRRFHESQGLDVSVGPGGRLGRH